MGITNELILPIASLAVAVLGAYYTRKGYFSNKPRLTNDETECDKQASASVEVPADANNINDALEIKYTLAQHRAFLEKQREQKLLNVGTL